MTRRTAQSRTLPMKAAGTQHLIDRTYREGGKYQWVRETYVNALEAGASRIEFGVEWQAVEAHGVYRRLIADNGRGMSPDDLVAFFNTFGGGGKPIGGVHENFGVGAKTSLLPWNRHGIVVVSWQDGRPAMIWVQRDVVTGEYGLRLMETLDEAGEVRLEAVYEPFDDPDHGCDWRKVRPAWLKRNGTVVVLLGNEPVDDTVGGDTSRDENDIKGISSYLNRRLWTVASGVEVTVDELRTADKTKWPRSAAEAHGPQSKKGYDRRTNQRRIEGARHYIDYRNSADGRLAGQGTVLASDGTEIDWYLWEGDRPAVQSYAALGGYIAALYRNELYDVSSHPAAYRSFGISERDVRSRLWLIARPSELDDDGRRGVYPRTDRNALLLKGGMAAGEPLPFHAWASDFAVDMPEMLRRAIAAARGGQDGTVDDTAWRERLADRFGSRWRIPRLRTAPNGAETTTPLQPSGVPRARSVSGRSSNGPGGARGGGRGPTSLGSGVGPVPAARVRVAGGIPRYRRVGADTVDDGMLAAWQPNDPEAPEGTVLLNVEHPVLVREIEHWQSLYPPHHAEDIADDVIDVYGQIAVSKVAHSEHLKGLLPTEVIEKDFRSPAALTMALLGLLAEEAVIATRVGGKYGKKRPKADPDREPATEVMA